MKMGEAIKNAMKIRGVTQTDLAKKLNAKTQSVIAGRLNHPNMSINNALEMLNELGYEITIQPKKAGRRPEGQIVITMEDKE